MPRKILVGAALIVIIASFFFIPSWIDQQKQHSADSSSEKVAQDHSSILEVIPSSDASTNTDLPAQASLENRPIRVLDTALIAEKMHAADRTATEDLDILLGLLDDYHRLFQEMPEGGLNEEIVAALCGKNSKRLAVISPKHSSLSPKGQLLDRYGTPYYFHPISASKLEVRSAGPDCQLFTKDDITVDSQGE